jgi:hypothetical protein
MPVAAAPQDDSQSALIEDVLKKLLEKVIGGIPTTPTTPTTPPIPGTTVDLSKIEASLANLTERVENINTTLRTHGETLVGISDRLDKLERKGSGDANVGNTPAK